VKRGSRRTELVPFYNPLVRLEDQIVNDLIMLAIATGFAALSWLLLLLSDVLMGGKP
jgi:hypothetical protein